MRHWAALGPKIVEAAAKDEAGDDYSSLPGLTWLLHQPHPLRDVIELVIGVPIAFGSALYLVVEAIDLLWFLSTPIRKLSATARRR